MPSPTSAELRFARLAALTDADADTILGQASRDVAAADAGGTEALGKRVAEQHQLQAACSRIMKNQANGCPDFLRTQIIAAIDNPTSTSVEPVIAGRIAPHRWVGAVAAAALIAVSTMSVVGTLRTLRTAPETVLLSLSQVLNPKQITNLDLRHGICGEDPSALVGNSEFPRNVAGLNRHLGESLDMDAEGLRLDLSDIGFHYRGAGHCIAPGPGAVHLVYGNNSGQSLSLWLRTDDGTLSLDEEFVYGAPADSPHSGRLRVWREGNMLLYVVGDRAEDVQNTVPQLALHPA